MPINHKYLGARITFFNYVDFDASTFHYIAESVPWHANGLIRSDISEVEESHLLSDNPGVLRPVVRTVLRIRRLVACVSLKLIRSFKILFESYPPAGRMNAR